MFKIGDKIIVVNVNGLSCPKVGEIYTVEKVSGDNSIILKEKPTWGWYSDYHFKLYDNLYNCKSRCKGCSGRCDLWEDENPSTPS